LYKESTTNFVPHEPDEDELRQMFIWLMHGYIPEYT
jgi:hypothetical protein